MKKFAKKPQKAEQAPEKAPKGPPQKQQPTWATNNQKVTGVKQRNLSGTKSGFASFSRTIKTPR